MTKLEHYTSEVKEYFPAYKLQIMGGNYKYKYWACYISMNKANQPCLTIADLPEWDGTRLVYRQSTAKKYNIHSSPNKKRLRDIEKSLIDMLCTKFGFTNRTKAIEDCAVISICNSYSLDRRKINYHFNKIEGEII